MNFLAKEVIMSEAANVKPGTIARIGYRTYLPVKTQFKKQGVEIIKLTETSARLGVRYTHIAEVIARKSSQDMIQTAKRTNNYEWVLKNKVRHNSATGKDYLYVAHFNKGHYTKNMYMIFDNGCVMMSKEEFLSSSYKHYVIDSYWKSNSDEWEVKNISFENIYRINSAGQAIDEVIL